MLLINAFYKYGIPGADKNRGFYLRILQVLCTQKSTYVIQWGIPSILKRFKNIDSVLVKILLCSSFEFGVKQINPTKLNEL